MIWKLKRQISSSPRLKMRRVLFSNHKMIFENAIFYPFWNVLSFFAGVDIIFSSNGNYFCRILQLNILILKKIVSMIFLFIKIGVISWTCISWRKWEMWSSKKLIIMTFLIENNIVPNWNHFQLSIFSHASCKFFFIYI